MNINRISAFLKRPIINIAPIKSTSELLFPIIIVGRCFGLLPVSVKKHKTTNNITFYFEWRCLKVAYSVIICIATGIVAFMCIYHISVGGFTSSRAVDVGFYISSALAVLSFTLLAKDWPELMKYWNIVDKNMGQIYGFPKNLSKHLIYTTAYFMTLATVEHLLYIIAHIVGCKEIHPDNCTALYYYSEEYPHFFDHVPYNPVLAILLQLIHLGSLFTWNYNNLFIILMSIIVTERFKQISTRLKSFELFKIKHKFWESLRKDYNSLSYLCYHLDLYISYIILLSYGTNLFFIVIQMYNSFRNIYHSMEKVYFWFSFGFLIFRTVAVSLYASRINDASKEALIILHSIPSSSYNEEIKRLLLQISFDEVVLTGNRMFRITRGLILNIAGAIVTYELVLMQFNVN